MAVVVVDDDDDDDDDDDVDDDDDDVVVVVDVAALGILVGSGDWGGGCDGCGAGDGGSGEA